MATLSEELIIGIGDQPFRWRALKADITDHCILGLDFNAKFKLDIKLSEKTWSVGDCVIPVHFLSDGRDVRAHTANSCAMLPLRSSVPCSSYWVGYCGRSACVILMMYTC